jgi:4-hydroxybenzoate polyprenyltransferase
MLKNIFKLIRVKNWLKNIFIFIPLVFSEKLFDLTSVQISLVAFITFSLASSIVYIFNDIIDAESDREHLIKRNRPIASKDISPGNGLVVAAFLILLLLVTLLFLPIYFSYVIIGYILLNLAYSIKLKTIVILDIMCIAAGFMLRVLGGAFAINVYTSKWLILTTLFLSLFLAVMKRKSESELLDNGNSRLVLKEYPPDFINQISAISSGAVIICYALYTVSERTINIFQTENLVFTTIFFIFGIFRYMHIVYTQKKGEDTIAVLLKDIPMILNAFLYLTSVLVILYL